MQATQTTVANVFREQKDSVTHLRESYKYLYQYIVYWYDISYYY